MRTHITTGCKVPEYDSVMVDWLRSYTPPELDGEPRRVGILADIDGSKIVYRAIDGLGIWEIGDAYTFLASIGLVDLQIYNHPRFNCIYGLPDHKPRATDAFTVTCFGS